MLRTESAVVDLSARFGVLSRKVDENHGSVTAKLESIQLTPKER